MSAGTVGAQRDWLEYDAKQAELDEAMGEVRTCSALIARELERARPDVDLVDSLTRDRARASGRVRLLLAETTEILRDRGLM